MKAFKSTISKSAQGHKSWACAEEWIEEILEWDLKGEVLWSKRVSTFW